MSLGVKDEVETQILQCINEIGPSKAIEVAERLFYNGVKLLMCFCAVGVKMMDMESKGSLTFKEGRYEVVKQE